MLENIFPVEELRGLARKNKLSYITRTVLNSKVDEALSAGWEIEKRAKDQLALKKIKHIQIYWRIGFGAFFIEWVLLTYQVKEVPCLRLIQKMRIVPKNQIDVVGLDSEVAIAVECKSSEEFKNVPPFKMN